MKTMILLRELGRISTYTCVVCVLFGVFGSHVSASPKPVLRGVAPQDRDYFSKSRIECRDGSKVIPIQRVNDNFCDCPDGTDEPGTSACPSGKFYCRNRGHVPYLLFSSRVNDGICDCCDGSDEYEGRVTCQNRCKEEGATSREQLTEQVATYNEGLKLRNKIVEDAQSMKQSWDEEIKKLRLQEEEAKVKEAQLSEEKAAVEKAERDERELREKLEKEQEALKEASKESESPSPPVGEEGATDTAGESATESIQDGGESDDDDHDDFIAPEGGVEESPEHPSPLEEAIPESPSEPGEENLEGLSKEEIGRRVASRWTGGGAADPPPPPPPSPKDMGEEDEVDHTDEPPEDPEDDDSHGDEDDGGMDHHHPDEGEYPDDEDDTPETPGKILTEAEQVKKNHRDAAQELRSLQNKIEDLQKKLANDYGPSGEFISLVDQCFKLTINQYVYEICPFKEARQLEGHINTRLGTWEGFLDNYSKLAFRNGDRCWNGPERSMTVTLQCGLKNEIFAVDEPSRCEYAAVMSTPAVCSASRAKELQEELDEKLRELPEGSHDEL